MAPGATPLTAKISIGAFCFSSTTFFFSKAKIVHEELKKYLVSDITIHHYLTGSEAWRHVYQPWPCILSTQVNDRANLWSLNGWFFMNKLVAVARHVPKVAGGERVKMKTLGVQDFNL